MLGRRSVPSAATPFLRDALHVRRLMAFFFIAALPAAAAAVSSEGGYAFLLILVSVASALAADAAICLTRKKTLSENVWAAGLLFALTLPATLPLPWAALGAAGGVLLMHLFGGMGKHWLNPALAGRCGLELLMPAAFRQSGALVDLSSGPMAALLIAGGLFLIVTRVTSWQVVFSVFAGAAGFLLFQGWQAAGVFAWEPRFSDELLRAPFLLGAFFLAADPLNAPLTRWGRIACGLAIGALALFLDQKTALSEGIFFAALALNPLSPALDRVFFFLLYRGKGKKA
jgi:Na+-translocating ferredoxin:NAD+ oxidoreductase RnfD subunit